MLSTSTLRSPPSIAATSFLGEESVIGALGVSAGDRHPLSCVGLSRIRSFPFQRSGNYLILDLALERSEVGLYGHPSLLRQLSRSARSRLSLEIRGFGNEVDHR